jgi:trk system potassium uptake protein TrkA
MYIIVAGGGKVGYYLTKTLVNEGYEVLLIEKNKKKVETYAERFGAVVLQGDACEASVLADAGAARADVVIAVTGDDEDNLVICQMAKKKFNVPRTIARVNNPKNEEIFKILGVDVTVSATNVILSLIEQEIPSRHLVHLLTLRHAELAMVEATVTPNSEAAGKPVGEIKLPPDTAITLIVRKGQLIVPSPSVVLMPEDEVIALAHRRSEAELRAILVGESAPV